jgi:hypothetical protein
MLCHVLNLNRFTVIRVGRSPADYRLCDGMDSMCVTEDGAIESGFIIPAGIAEAYSRAFRFEFISAFSIRRSGITHIKAVIA